MSGWTTGLVAMVLSWAAAEPPARVEPGAIAPASPTYVGVCFAPEQDCVRIAIGMIDQAQKTIRMHAYELTMGSGIPAALMHARQRGVDVQIIADRRAPCVKGSGLPLLLESGALIFIDKGDHNSFYAHEKAIIIDAVEAGDASEGTVIEGSWNPSANASRNSEDMVIMRGQVAAWYLQHWQRRFALAQQSEYRGPEAWCSGREW